MEFIDLKKQYALHKQAIDAAIHRVLDHGQYILGPEVQELESALGHYVGVEHAIGVASGTDALLIALMALDVGPGDEVITVPFTWISTSEVIALLGATPVFVDVDPESFNMDVAQVEARITSRTKALLPVSLFGQMADFPSLASIAERYELPVIEDGAQSFGATQWGRRSGSVTQIGVTSFYPSKPLGCYGDGGAIFTNSERLAREMRAIHVHGVEGRHHHPLVGINGRLDTLQAAILQEKLKTFPQELLLRQKIADNYHQGLSSVCRVPQVLEGGTHTWAQYTIRCEERDRMAALLAAQGVPTAVHYPKCLHQQPVFANLGYGVGSFPVAERASREVLSLPMHPWLTAEEQQQVIDAVCACCEAGVVGAL